MTMGHHPFTLTLWIRCPFVVVLKYILKSTQYYNPGSKCFNVNSQLLILVPTLLFLTLEVKGWHFCGAEGSFKRTTKCCYHINIWKVEKEKRKTWGNKENNTSLKPQWESLSNIWAYWSRDSQHWVDLESALWGILSGGFWWTTHMQQYP